MSREIYVIVGASLAGASAAAALRRSGFKGEIVLIGDELHLPYLRPPLSKHFLKGTYQNARLLIHPREFYDQNRIELRLGVRAVALDINARIVELASGDRIQYDRLLIANGACARRLSVPGAHLDGIHYLRTLDDAERIRAEMDIGRRVVVVGAGFIGGEVASVCRERGLEVVMVEMLRAPLQHILGEQIGSAIGNIHRENGVEVLTGERVIAFRGEKRVNRVVTSSGKVINCDFVVVGVGALPETSWLDGSGVYVDNGVVVNEYCETNVPGIYAAGDIANTWHPIFGERIRIEHETNAQQQGVAAARNMLGRRAPYQALPFVWSDQYDLELRYIGHARPDDTIILRGNPASRSFLAFYLRGTELRAVFGLNRSEGVEMARQLFYSRASLDAERLADERIDLQGLVASLVR